VTTKRRQTLWTCTPLGLTLAAGGAGVASQQKQDVASDFTTKTGRNLYNVTLTHAYLQGWWSQTVAATSPIWGNFVIAFLRAPSGMDAGDFGDLSNHVGDIEMYDCRQLLEAEGTDDVLFPRTDIAGSGLKIESRGQRKIAREDETMFIVVQKNAVTEQDITFRGAVTCTWLLP